MTFGSQVTQNFCNAPNNSKFGNAFANMHRIRTFSQRKVEPLGMLCQFCVAPKEIGEETRRARRHFNEKPDLFVTKLQVRLEKKNRKTFYVSILALTVQNIELAVGSVSQEKKCFSFRFSQRVRF